MWKILPWIIIFLSPPIRVDIGTVPVYIEPEWYVISRLIWSGILVTLVVLGRYLSLSRAVWRPSALTALDQSAVDLWRRWVALCSPQIWHKADIRQKDPYICMCIYVRAGMSKCPRVRQTEVVLFAPFRRRRKPSPFVIAGTFPSVHSRNKQIVAIIVDVHWGKRSLSSYIWGFIYTSSLSGLFRFNGFIPWCSNTKYFTFLVFFVKHISKY